MSTPRTSRSAHKNGGGQHPMTTWLAPTVEAEAFGRVWPCTLVYAGDVDEPPDPNDPFFTDGSWLNYDEGRGELAVGLDWKGGPVGFNVPITVRYAGRRRNSGAYHDRQPDDGSQDEVKNLVALLKRLGYTNVRAERAKRKT